MRKVGKKSYFLDLNPSTSTTSSPATSSSTEKSSNDELKGKFLSYWNNMRYGFSGKLLSGRSFNRDSAIWVLGRCYHQKVTPSPSIDTSMVEVERNRNPIDNKLMSLSLHEEMPTSSESYFNLDTAASPTAESNEIDRAIEPAEEIGTDVAEDYEDGFDGFKKDFISRIWMTYRKDFAMMQSEIKSSPSSGYTSDCGWGCMIRSGQMLLAQALVTHFLGRGWRYDPDSQIYSTTEDHIHRKIIRWFGDNLSRNSPFSIHKMVELGKKNGKKIGEWYGPGSVAHVLKEAVKLAAKENPDLSQLHVYVAIDCTIYNQDIFDECYSQESQIVPWQKKSNSTNTSPTKQKKITTWKKLILLIPLRLGHEKLNPIYGECIKAMLSLDWCIGIIGGRPKHSLYFIGYQEDRLIHLDPHYCQDAVDVNVENFSIASFHCRSARKMKISKMDPSCCLGFYIPSRTEYDRFQKTIHPYLQPVINFNERQQKSSAVNCMQSNDYVDPYNRCNYPMFIFRNGRLADERSKALRMKASSLSTIAKSSSRLNDDDDDEDEGDDDDGIEDFVII